MKAQASNPEYELKSTGRKAEQRLERPKEGKHMQPA
jgi:hypothetical protein